MNIKAFILLSCCSWFSARAAQTAISDKERANEKVESRPNFKELVQKALDRQLHIEFAKKSSEISTSGPTDEIILNSYSTFKRTINEWSKTLRNVCRIECIFGGENLLLRELIDVGFSRILKAEGVNVSSDIFSGKFVLPGDKISRVYSKVLNTHVDPKDSDNLISSLAWLFLEYSRIYPEKKAMLLEEPVKGLSVQAHDMDLEDKNQKRRKIGSPAKEFKRFEFRPEFKKLVQEVIDKKLSNLVSLSTPALELTLMEEGIVKKFRLNQTKRTPLPWGIVLVEECRERNIFGREPINVEQLIPIALSRILKAEGADINEMLSGTTRVSWNDSSANVSQIFSKIMDLPVIIDFYQMSSTVLWLILKYHEMFPDKRVILLNVCEEELKLQGLVTERPIVGSTGNLKRKIEEVAGYETSSSKKVRNETNITSIPVSPMAPPPAPKPFSNNNLDVSAQNPQTRVVQTPVTVKEPTIFYSKNAEFSSDFKKLVKNALNRNLNGLFSRNSLFISTSRLTDRIIHKVYLEFKNCNDLKFNTNSDVWKKTIRKVCQEQGIFGDKFMTVDELIHVGFSRILKAEGVDIDDIISGDSFSHEELIFQVYYKVLDTALSTSSDNLIPSATWLFLEYFRMFPAKRATLWGEAVAESKVHAYDMDIEDTEHKKPNDIKSNSTAIVDLTINTESVMQPNSSGIVDLTIYGVCFASV